MSYQEVNDLKNHINQLVLGQCQTYVNQTRKDIYELVTVSLFELNLSLKQEVQSQGRLTRDTLQVILRGLVQDFDEEDLTG